MIMLHEAVGATGSAASAQLGYASGPPEYVSKILLHAALPPCLTAGGMACNPIQHSRDLKGILVFTSGLAGLPITLAMAISRHD